MRHLVGPGAAKRLTKAAAHKLIGAHGRHLTPSVLSAVLVVIESGRGGERDLYVALTRATTRLCTVTNQPARRIGARVVARAHPARYRHGPRARGCSLLVRVVLAQPFDVLGSQRFWKRRAAATSSAGSAGPAHA